MPISNQLLISIKWIHGELLFFPIFNNETHKFNNLNVMSPLKKRPQCFELPEN